MKKGKAFIMMLLAALFVTAMPVTVPMTAQAAPPTEGCSSNNNGPHEWVRNGGFPATCSNSGQDTYLCQKCQLWHSEPLPLNDQHRWNGGTETRVATCTQAGERVYTCEYSSLHTKTEVIPALGHAYDGGRVTKEPTCTQPGEKTFQCTRCTDTRTEQVAALGHNHETKVIKEATCTQAGERETKCTRCGESTKAQIPALGHNHVETVIKQATCTEAGEKETKCTRCGDGKKETIAALGHDWDGGKLVDTAGQKQKAGQIASVGGNVPDSEIVTTCRRCGETQTQIVPAGRTILDEQRGVPKDADKAQPLEITKQPVGGTIVRHKGEHKMDVAVKGGTAPYTFEWHCVITRSGPFSGSFGAGFDSVVKGYTIKGNAFSDAFARSRTKTMGRTMRPELRNGGFNGRIPAVTAGEEVVRQAPKTQTTSEYAADRSGTYYCVIRDAAGLKVTSDRVTVGYQMRISTQPKNINVGLAEPETTYCVASDGVAPYQYAWYRVGKTDFPALVSDTLDLQEEGEYYCVAMDAEGETATSDTIRIYRAAELTLTADESAVRPIREGLGTEFQVTVSGGVPANGQEPYTVYCGIEGESLMPEEDAAAIVPVSGNAETGFVYTFTAELPVTYVIRATDSVGVSGQTTITFPRKQLTIMEQPRSQQLRGDGKAVELRMKVSGNEGTVTYRLYRNGKYKSRNNIGIFKVTDTGTYYIHAKDSEGDEATSDNAEITENDFRITEYTEEAEITFRTTPSYVYDAWKGWTYRDEGALMPDKAELSVTAEGGNEPYRYQWMRLDPATGEYKNDAGTSQTNYVKEEGTWACEVSDSTGATAYVDNIRVTYEAGVPYITKQPQSEITLVRDFDQLWNLAFTAECDASVSGGWKSGISPEFTWYKLSGHWKAGGYSYDPGVTGGYIGAPATEAGTGAWHTFVESESFSLPGVYECRVSNAYIREKYGANAHVASERMVVNGRLNLRTNCISVYNNGFTRPCKFVVEFPGRFAGTAYVYESPMGYRGLFNQPRAKTVGIPGRETVRFESELYPVDSTKYVYFEVMDNKGFVGQIRDNRYP